MSHYCHSARSTAGCTALLIGILCAAGWLPAFSEEPPPKTTPLELTQVPVDALAFLQLRPADLLQGEVGKSCQARHTLARLLETFEVVKRVGVSLPEMEKLTLVWPTEKHAFSPLIVVTTIEQIDRTRLLATLLPECRAHQLKGQTYCTSPKTGRKAIRFLGEHVFVEGAVEDIVQLLIKPPSPAARGAQTPALDWAAENHSVVVGLRLPEEQTEEDRQQLYLALPKEGPLQTLLPPLVKPLKAVQSVALRMDTEKSLDLRLELHFATEGEASNGLWAARDGLALGRVLLRPFLDEVGKNARFKAITPSLQQIESGLRGTTVEQSGRVLRIALQAPGESAQLAGNVFPFLDAVSWSRQSTQRVESVKKLQEINKGIQDYQNARGTLPTAALVSKDGKPLLSWRVAILPYIGQEPLHKQFKLDEPWDSAENKKLLPQMPKVFAPVLGGTKEPNSTWYQVFVGKGSVFGGELGVTMREIEDADGSANTLTVVEAGEAIPWTKPGDLPFEADKPLPPVGGQFKEGAHVLFCNGVIRFLHHDVLEDKLLRALVTWNGGETIDLSKLE